MKLDKNLIVYINYRTNEEREMVLDIFEHLGVTWLRERLPREVESYNAPARFLLERGHMYKGTSCLTVAKMNGKPVIEARDLRNQWISLKRRKENEAG